MGVAAWGLTVFADGPDDGAKESPRKDPRKTVRRLARGPRRVQPLEVALDQDHDNLKSPPEELDAATASLKKLDKNGDGKLTPEEYRPPRSDQLGRGPGSARVMDKVRAMDSGPRDGQGPRERCAGPRDGDGAGRKRPAARA